MQTDRLNAAAQAMAPGISGVAKPPAAAPFSGVLQDAMSNLKGLEDQASTAVDGLIGGRGVDVHAAMIATQKSDMAFEMALAVRGKLVSAYQSMMGVQF